MNFSSFTKEEYQLQHYELQPLMTFEIQTGPQFHVSSDCADGNSLILQIYLEEKITLVYILQ